MCTIQSGACVFAPSGQLFAEVALTDALNEDTDAGQSSSVTLAVLHLVRCQNILMCTYSGNFVLVKSRLKRVFF